MREEPFRGDVNVEDFNMKLITVTGRGWREPISIDQRAIILAHEVDIMDPMEKRSRSV